MFEISPPHKAEYFLCCWFGKTVHGNTDCITSEDSETCDEILEGNIRYDLVYGHRQKKFDITGYFDSDLARMRMIGKANEAWLST